MVILKKDRRNLRREVWGRNGYCQLGRLLGGSKLAGWVLRLGVRGPGLHPGSAIGALCELLCCLLPQCVHLYKESEKSFNHGELL